MEVGKGLTALADLTAMEERFLAAAKDRPEFVMELHHRLCDVEGDEPTLDGNVDGFGRVTAEYTRLIHDPEDGLEALKRAFFLHWFQAGSIESWGWGIDQEHFGWAIYEDSQESEWELIHEVDRQCREWAQSPDLALSELTIDVELQFMIRWYHAHSRAAFDFDHFMNFDPVWNTQRNVPYLFDQIWMGGPVLLLRRVFSQESLANRGLMGRYFRALLDEESRLAGRMVTARS